MASPALGPSEVEHGMKGRVLQQAIRRLSLACNNTLCYLPQEPVHLWAAGPQFLHLKKKVFGLDVKR